MLRAERGIVIPPSIISLELPKKESNFIALPRSAERLFSDLPIINHLLAEAAEIDPSMFFHGVMTAECYALMRQDYIKRITASFPLQVVQELDHYLKQYDAGVFLHDIGKWLIDRKPRDSMAIFNALPPNINETRKPSNLALDQRSREVKALQHLHSAAGGYLLLDLFDHDHFSTSQRKMIKLWSEVIFAHHEQNHDRNPIISLDNREIYSYPRNKSRLSTSSQKLAHLLIKLADITVSMGQPRIYRPVSLPPEKILLALETLLSDQALKDIFGPINPDELIRTHRSFLTMSMMALEKIQAQYSSEICLHPAGFIVSNKPLGSFVNEEGLHLDQAAKQLWQKHGKRFEEIFRLCR